MNAREVFSYTWLIERIMTCDLNEVQEHLVCTAKQDHGDLAWVSHTQVGHSEFIGSAGSG